MILRVVRLTLKDGVESEFMQHARRRAKELVETVDGLVDMQLARRLDGTTAVVLAMSRWRDYEAMERFYGQDLDKPRLWDPNDEWAETATIEHLQDEFATTDVDEPLLTGD